MYRHTTFTTASKHDLLVNMIYVAESLRKGVISLGTPYSGEVMRHPDIKRGVISVSTVTDPMPDGGHDEFLQHIVGFDEKSHVSFASLHAWDGDKLMGTVAAIALPNEGMIDLRFMGGGESMPPIAKAAMFESACFAFEAPEDVGPIVSRLFRISMGEKEERFLQAKVALGVVDFRDGERGGDEEMFATTEVYERFATAMIEPFDISSQECQWDYAPPESWPR